MGLGLGRKLLTKMGLMRPKQPEAPLIIAPPPTPVADQVSATNPVNAPRAESAGVALANMAAARRRRTAQGAAGRVTPAGRRRSAAVNTASRVGYGNNPTPPRTLIGS